MIMMKHFHTGPLYVNTYVVYDSERKIAFIVDPGGVNPAIDSFIETNKLKVEFIILTHGHGDHIGGAEAYRDKYKAPIYAHKAEKEMLSSPAYNSSKMMFSKPIAFMADRWLTDGEEIPFGDTKLKIIHTPGHSPGGICILIGKWLFSGDTLFAGSVGRTDFALCNAQHLFDSIREKLFVLDDDVEVYPGHEGFTTIGNEKKYNPFF